MMFGIVFCPPINVSDPPQLFDLLRDQVALDVERREKVAVDRWRDDRDDDSAVIGLSIAG